MSNTIDTITVQALLQRGRGRMVEAYLNEGALINPNEMHTYWRGFAACAKALLDDSAQVMASHDEASTLDGAVQAAFARLPNDPELLTLADMKRHMWAQGIDSGADLITDSNVNVSEQLQNRVGTTLKVDDEHPVLAVDVGNGGVLHGNESPVFCDAGIVTQGGAL